MLYGAIEAGGTKFVCAVLDEKANILEKTIIDTLDPGYTMGKAVEFFKNYDIVSLGIGTFGPVDINPESHEYGTILNTPKLIWRNFNMIKYIKSAINVPIKIDTDVNAAALCEYKMGAGKGKKSVLYITIGTGIGAGFVWEGRTLIGLTHPEMGHILIRPLEGDDFEGVCPSHGNCFEGLVSGPAIEKRCGKKAQLLPEDNEVWAYVADYIGQALMTYTLILSPEIILIGGGVSQQEHIFPMIHAAFRRHMNGYVQHRVLDGDLSDYIRYPENGQMAGLYGAYHLALQAYEKNEI